MNRVLITGADWPAGAEVARRLAGDGYEVRAQLPPGADAGDLGAGEVQIVTGDLADADFTRGIMRDLEAVVHLAVRPVPPEGVSEAENLRYHFLGTLNLVQGAVERGYAFKRFVCGSSSSVYPNDSHVLAPACHPVEEQHPTRPLDTYALSRLGAEEIARAYALSAGLPVTVIRESGVATPDTILQRWTVGFVKIILELGLAHPASEIHSPEIPAALEELDRRALSPEQPCAVTDRAGRPWLYQLVDYRDLAHGILCALTHPAAVGRVYNLAAAAPVSFVYAARRLGQALDRPVLEWQAPVRWVFDLDCTRARTEIGYRPHWDLDRMLTDALARG